MVDAKEFLTDFCKDLIAHPAHRIEMIAGYAKHMEAREQSIVADAAKVTVGPGPSFSLAADLIIHEKTPEGVITKATLVGVRKVEETN